MARTDGTNDATNHATDPATDPATSLIGGHAWHKRHIGSDSPDQSGWIFSVGPVSPSRAEAMPPQTTTSSVGRALVVGNDYVLAASAVMSGTIAASVTNNSSVDALAVPAARSEFAAATGGTLNGAGLTIGILSDSFNLQGGQSTDIANGDLPPASQINILQEGTAGSDEGRAMAQLIHQIAPGATIDFYSATISENSFAAGITALVTAGANVIVDDVSYTDEPFYQNTGTVTQAVEAAVAKGVAYFTSANNSGNNFYEAVFTPLPFILPGISPVIANNIAGSGSPYEAVTLGANAKLDFTVEWTQPYGSNTYDIGVGLYRLSGSTYKLVQNFSNAGITTDPVLSVQTTLTNTAGSYYLAFYDSVGSVTAGSTFKIVFFQDSNATVDGTGAGVGSGTVIGHELATGANAVAAVNVSQTPANSVATPVVEGFSATGPGKTYIDAAGTTLATPITDNAPAFAATDGTPTSIFNPFYGTSAAAPNAAAVGLLMLQADSRLVPVQVTALLERSAIPTASTITGGAGLIQASTAVASAITAASTPIWTAQGGSTSWAVAANWSDSKVPGAADAVQITDGDGLFTAAFSVACQTPASSVASLAVDGGAGGARPDLAIASADALATGTLTLGQGTIDIFGTLTDSGAVLAGSGTGAVMVESTGRMTVGAGVAGSAIAFVGAGGSVTFATANAATLASGIADTVSNFAAGDILDFSNLPYASVAQLREGSGTVALVDAQGAILAQLTLTGSFAATNGLTFAADSSGTGTDIVACYAAGTRILTRHGERAIESLRAGDEVVSVLRQRLVPVVWIGHRHLDFRNAGTAGARPIRVRAGAFGQGLPHTDMLLSPEHAVFADGALVPVGRLVNGASICVAEEIGQVTYYHVELPRHDVMLAEGLPAESWCDTGNRAMFANAPAMVAKPARVQPCAPFLDAAGLVHLRARLAGQAAALGLAPLMECVVQLVPGTCCAVLPAGAEMVRLLCASAAGHRDRRRLGALIGGVTLDGTMLDLADTQWRGFHAVERHAGHAVRWTDGDAMVRVPPADIDRILTVDVVAVPRAVPQDVAA